MADRDSAHFRQILLDRRDEIFGRVFGLESRWRDLKEREVELEEEAQKMSVTSLYDQLAARDRVEMEEIDRALLKIEEGSFGRCERCRRPIPQARLEAFPETRLCLSCARRSESKPGRPKPGREAISCGAAAPGYEDFSDEDLEQLIMDALQNDGRVDMQELEITCRRGTIRLDGILPNEVEHQIVLRTLGDLICSGSIVDRVEISEVLSGEEEETVGGFGPEAVDEEKTTDDPFEMQEEDFPFTVPDRPPAEAFPAG